MISGNWWEAIEVYERLIREALFRFGSRNFLYYRFVVIFEVFLPRCCFGAPESFALAFLRVCVA